jgi:hypothetical protein
VQRIESLVFGVVASVVAAALLWVFGALGLAWSAAVGGVLISASTLWWGYQVRRRTAHDHLRRILGIAMAREGPNEEVEAMFDSARTSIDFWGVSANRTARSPLATAAMKRVGSHGGSVRFLLLVPQCSSVARRAAEEGEDPAAWSGEIRGTVTRLERLAERESIDIQVRYTTEYPIWRMVILDRDRILLNWFLPRRPGHHSPMAVITATEDGLFWPLQRSFEETWNRAEPAGGT